MPTTVQYTYRKKVSGEEETKELEEGLLTCLETYFPTIITKEARHGRVEYEIPSVFGLNTIQLRPTSYMANDPKELTHEVCMDITTSGFLGGNLNSRLKKILADAGFNYDPESMIATHTTLFENSTEAEEPSLIETFELGKEHTYEFLKVENNAVREYRKMRDLIGKVAKGKPINRGKLGQGSRLYEVRGFLGKKSYIELEPINIGQTEGKQEGVYLQVHTFGSIPGQITNILEREGYQPCPPRRD
ncbi:MAG: hypothetical protein WCI72_01045 [archaeon]